MEVKNTVVGKLEKKRLLVQCGHLRMMVVSRIQMEQSGGRRRRGKIKRYWVDYVQDIMTSIVFNEVMLNTGLSGEQQLRDNSGVF